MKYPVISALSEKLSVGHQTEEDLIELIDYVDGATGVKPVWATDADVETVKFARNCYTSQTAADTVIIPIQDYLGYGARMNTPGTTGDDNWSYRIRHDALSDSIAYNIAHLTKLYKRNRE